MNNTINYTKQGEDRGLIKFNSDRSSVTYLHQKISRNYNNPEEKVQAEAFCKLVLYYKYPVAHIRQYVSVTVGSDTKQADIIVYNDDYHKSPHIVVECKRDDVSEQEFAQATNQAFAYAHATAGTLKYVWTTSGIKEVYHKFDKESDLRETVSDIPQYAGEMERFLTSGEFTFFPEVILCVDLQANRATQESIDIFRSSITSR